jgi:nitrogen regulation protein NR(I)
MEHNSFPWQQLSCHPIKSTSDYLEKGGFSREFVTTCPINDKKPCRFSSDRAAFVVRNGTRPCGAVRSSQLNCGRCMLVFSPIHAKVRLTTLVGSRRLENHLPNPQNHAMSTILVVDDDPADRQLITRTLEKSDYHVSAADSVAEALKLVQQDRPDVALLDVLLPDGDGIELYREIRKIDSTVPIVFVTASGSSSTAIEAMQLGALDYLVKPLQVAEVRRVVARAMEVRRMVKDPVIMDPGQSSVTDGDVIIGRSPAMQGVYKAIGIVASQNVTVLIRGESGTGKELVARALYQFGSRSDGPFLAVNCAAIPETLLESELFGHEKGAFTGADKRRIGKFEQCNQGTLFLDEIGDMPPLLQSKILRVLQDGKFQRVGGDQTIATDVRLIAATNRNLERMVAENSFREDLFYRLNGYTIHLPPLRDRGRDLDLLIDHFWRQANRELGKDIQGISPQAVELLRQHDWPGNVRELQNVMRQAVLQTTGPVLLPDFLPASIHKSSSPSTRDDEPASLTDVLDRIIAEKIHSGSQKLYDDVIAQVEERLVTVSLEHSGGDKLAAIQMLGVNPATIRSPAALSLLDRSHAPSDHDSVDSLIYPGMTMEEIEREAIRRALKQTDGKRTEAAQMLGISVRTLQRKIKEYSLE